MAGSSAAQQLFDVPHTSSPAHTEQDLKEHFADTLASLRGSPIPPADRERVETNVLAVASSLLAQFPAPLPSLKWDTNQFALRVEFAKSTIEIVAAVANQVEAFYIGQEELIKLLIAHLIYLCTVLDLWVDADYGKPVITPVQLRNTAIEAIARVLRTLGEISYSASDESSWRLLSSILKEWLLVCQGRISILIV